MLYHREQRHILAMAGLVCTVQIFDEHAGGHLHDVGIRVPLCDGSAAAI